MGLKRRGRRVKQQHEPSTDEPKFVELPRRPAGPRKTAATRSDYSGELKQIPDKTKGIFSQLHLSRRDADALLLGFVPFDMDDRWFVFSEEDQIYFYRSWFGDWAFSAKIVLSDSNAMIRGIRFNPDLGMSTPKDWLISTVEGVVRSNSDPSRRIEDGEICQVVKFPWREPTLGRKCTTGDGSTVTVVDLEMAGGKWTRALVETETGDKEWLERDRLEASGMELRPRVKKPRGASGSNKRRGDEPGAGATAREPHGLTGNLPLGSHRPPGNMPCRVVKVPEDIYGMLPSPVAYAVNTLASQFRQRYSTRPKGEEWTVWYGKRDYDPGGRIFWIAFSPPVPDAIVEAVADSFGSLGVQLKLGTCAPTQSDLDYLMWAGDDGIELLSMF